MACVVDVDRCAAAIVPCYHRRVSLRGRHDAGADIRTDVDRIKDAALAHNEPPPPPPANLITTKTRAGAHCSGCAAFFVSKVFAGCLLTADGKKPCAGGGGPPPEMEILDVPEAGRARRRRRVQGRRHLS